METEEMLKIVNQDFITFVDTTTADPTLLTKKDKNDRTLLHWTALMGLENHVEHLLTFKECTDSIDAIDDTAATPLILATLKGNRNIVKWLVEKGANINARNWQGHSPLQYACSKGWKDIVVYLLDKGADINVKDNRGDTSIHRLASLGRTEILNIFLNSKDKPKLDTPNAEGNTALHIACEDDETACALLLVEHKADPHAENKEKKTPLDLCKPGLRRTISEKCK